MSRLVGLSYEALILEAIREPLLELVNEHPFSGVNFTPDGAVLTTDHSSYVLVLGKVEAQTTTSA